MNLGLALKTGGDGDYSFAVRALADPSESLDSDYAKWDGSVTYVYETEINTEFSLTHCNFKLFNAGASTAPEDGRFRLRFPVGLLEIFK
jgi:hypothetical protein